MPTSKVGLAILWILATVHSLRCAVWTPKDNLTPLQPGTYYHAALICDAGSTGSRVFAFYVPSERLNSLHDVEVELMGRTQVGLSAYAGSGSVRNASDSLLPLLRKGIDRLGASVPIFVFATGGVRALEDTVKQALWASMKRDLTSALQAVHSGSLSVRTVDGLDEALFGLLSSNYLLSDMTVNDIGSPLISPVSVLDLGGSSLEVSLVGPDKIAGSNDDVLISFKTLGMSQFRERVSIVDGAGACNFGTVCTMH